MASSSPRRAQPLAALPRALQALVGRLLMAIVAVRLSLNWTGECLEPGGRSL